MKVQMLEKDGKEAFAVLPIDEYRELVQRLEDLEDAQDLRSYRTNPDESYPSEVVNRLLDGETPVKVWREYRRLTQGQLAEHTGVTVAHISQIESGKRECSVKLLRALTRVLEVDADLLIGQEER